jgi:hypothetical protein
MSEFKWSYNEFLTFLMIYVGHVDIEFSDVEKELIKKAFGPETFEKIYAQFKGLSDYQAYETILSYKGVYYPTATQKDEILSKVRELTVADGEFNVMEKELIHFFERMM